MHKTKQITRKFYNPRKVEEATPYQKLMAPPNGSYCYLHNGVDAMVDPKCPLHGFQKTTDGICPHDKRVADPLPRVEELAIWPDMTNGEIAGLTVKKLNELVRLSNLQSEMIERLNNKR